MTMSADSTKTSKGVQLHNLPRGRLHIEQYNRVLRYYERFKLINDGRQKGSSFEGQYDDMLGFFMNCHHLKDWIIQDFYIEKGHPDHPEYCRLRDEVVHFIDSYDCLKLCADICNGAKHLYRNEPLHFGETIRVRNEVHIDETVDDPPVQRVLRITSESGKEWDAFELANECLSKWKEFFAGHKKVFQTLMDQPEEGSTTGVADRTMEANVIGSERSVLYRVISKPRS